MSGQISESEPALRALDLGRKLQDAGDVTAALHAYREAIRWDPKWTVPWYNIGLLHKYAGRWAESLEANLEAVRLDSSNKPAIWNAGIAATALGDWPAARHAWKRYGIDIAEGDDPVDYPCGLTPIRVALVSAPEVVWTRRIDPARAVIVSVPLATSGRRYGDLLLHDGAPNGYRRLGERDVAVFDELQLLQASAYLTFEVRVDGASAAEVLDLEARCDSAKLVLEDWTSNLRILCKACSEGRPDDDAGHDHGGVADAVDLRCFGIAAVEAAEVRGVLDEWLGATLGASLTSFDCVLDTNAIMERT